MLEVAQTTEQIPLSARNSDALSTASNSTDGEKGLDLNDSAEKDPLSARNSDAFSIASNSADGEEVANISDSAPKPAESTHLLTQQGATIPSTKRSVEEIVEPLKSIKPGDLSPSTSATILPTSVRHQNLIQFAIVEWNATIQ